MIVNRSETKCLERHTRQENPSTARLPCAHYNRLFSVQIGLAYHLRLYYGNDFFLAQLKDIICQDGKVLIIISYIHNSRHSLHCSILWCINTYVKNIHEMYKLFERSPLLHLRQTDKCSNLFPSTSNVEKKCVIYFLETNLNQKIAIK
jgi:hypothetical protein